MANGASGKEGGVGAASTTERRTKAACAPTAITMAPAVGTVPLTLLTPFLVTNGLENLVSVRNVRSVSVFRRRSAPLSLMP